MPEGDEKFRLLVMGHLEPDEWKTGAQDAPVVRDSTVRQLIAAGLDADDARLKGTLKISKCKPASRNIRQLGGKLMVTDQDRLNAEAAQHPGQDSGGIGNPTPGTPHQHLKWALMPIGSLFRGPQAASRSGAEARENPGTLGPQDSRHWAAARASAIANLPPMIETEPL